MSTWEEEKVSFGKRASYSWGFVYSYIQIAGITILIFHYYEVELGLPVFYVGLAIIIFAAWNMVNDPLLGFLTDKPMRWSKKWGLRLPWILFGGSLSAIFYFLMFDVSIVGVDDPLMLFWYLVIITCLYDTFFTIFSTHYAGGFTNIFRTRDDRRKGGTIGQWSGNLGRFIMLGILVPFFIIPGDPESYVRAAMIVGLIMFISLILFIPGMYENEAVKARYFKVYEYLESVKLPYFKFLRIAFKQKNYKVSVFGWLMFNISFFLYFANTLYFVNEVIPPSERVYMGMSIIVGAAITYTLAFNVTIFLWSRYVADRIDHHNTYALGLILLGICYLASMWINTGFEYVVWHLLGGIGIAAFSAVFMSIGADVNDEVTNACGRHQEAALGGISTFIYRFAFAFMGLTMALTHILTGYAPGAAEQTDLAKLGIRILVGLIPALVCFAGAFVMYKFYDLKGEKREQIMKSLREKGL